MVSKTVQRKITEQPSHYNHLERMSVGELLQHINDEDHLVAEAVSKALPQIEALVEAIEPRMKRGGRLFYIKQRMLLNRDGVTCRAIIPRLTMLSLVLRPLELHLMLLGLLSRLVSKDC